MLEYLKRKKPSHLSGQKRNFGQLLINIDMDVQIWNKLLKDL
jgi:hypothetical protein